MPLLPKSRKRIRGSGSSRQSGLFFAISDKRVWTFSRSSLYATLISKSSLLMGNLVILVRSVVITFWLGMRNSWLSKVRHYREISILFQGQNDPGHKVRVIVRAYNDGMAFRVTISQTTRFIRFSNYQGTNRVFVSWWLYCIGCRLWIV